MVDGTGLEPVTPCTSRNVGLKTQVSFFSEQLRLNGFSVLEMLKLYNAWIFTAILRPTNNASSYSPALRFQLKSCSMARRRRRAKAAGSSR